MQPIIINSLYIVEIICIQEFGSGRSFGTEWAGRMGPLTWRLLQKTDGPVVALKTDFPPGRYPIQRYNIAKDDFSSLMHARVSPSGTRTSLASPARMEVSTSPIVTADWRRLDLAPAVDGEQRRVEAYTDA